MAKKVLNRHRPHLRLHDSFLLAGGRIDLFHTNLQILKFRKVVGHGRGDIQFALLDQRHGTNTDDRLGHRGDSEDRICGHGGLLFAVPEPEGSEVGDLVLAGDQYNCSGKLAAINIALEGPRHPLQAIGVKSKL